MRVTSALRAARFFRNPHHLGLLRSGTADHADPLRDALARAPYDVDSQHPQNVARMRKIACVRPRKTRIAAGAVRVKVESTVKCADCGVSTSVPFKPTQNRPVYCAECFLRQKHEQKVG